MHLTVCNMSAIECNRFDQFKNTPQCRQSKRNTMRLVNICFKAKLSIFARADDYSRKWAEETLGTLDDANLFATNISSHDG